MSHDRKPNPEIRDALPNERELKFTVEQHSEWRGSSESVIFLNGRQKYEHISIRAAGAGASSSLIC